MEESAGSAYEETVGCGSAWETGFSTSVLRSGYQTSGTSNSDGGDSVAADRNVETA